ncbi:winged helix-turn-helix domain-containing protein [Streptomyces thermoviolaceus]|uniref:Winged helix-turn-helix transcriptional regulator n=1 Tax=Streptomyces thermoviolaceus subsp. thermoviolaceus TaxID=66860 RepID=A0ABX0YMX4_STRTL|nr:winged helix-turn-helix domain-containing protein [Streptomyces thermoviolaceus]NJP13872.1 winged helix-turn-helix transcriptional regulator [Streptomyces thermoviolaceus subsp. thermoviolaceus]WTD49491.1 winged helix-turn-helix domain-containing protein [Streptomyces thermoviolaceus]GGV61451.1 transcriptional regulator [Streptomyces thermoviolaceus subsp. apingens]GHA79837.1 transcriptional regulator [Streptomyces thermoviolaceus subsp. thermoviolaceus]
MATTRSLTTATATAADAAPAPAVPRHRLRAVDRDERWEVSDSRPGEDLPDEVAAWLPPAATWLPAPQHTLPSLPGRPPMVGYLVLVPADRQPPFAPPAAPAPDEPADGHGDALVRIDTARRTAEVAGRPLDLTYLEFELLAHLVAHPHRVHSRDHLVSTVWGYGHVGDGRTVDVHIARLRRKLGAEHRSAIQTVRRVGYKYVPPTPR